MNTKNIICPGCGLEPSSDDTGLDKDFNASSACRTLYFELSYYTLSLRDTYFIHQLIVDAYAAQHSGPHVKPIATMFALAGLYAVNGRNFTGKEVQNMHIRMAKETKTWPRFSPPEGKKWLTVRNILAVPDTGKPEMIRTWSRSVWNEWSASQEAVRSLMSKYIS